MAIKKAKKRIKAIEPYDKTYQIKPLKMLVVIADRHQGKYFENQFKANGVSASFVTYAKGTATDDVKNILNINEVDKDIVLALVKSSEVENLKKICQQRFNTSPQASGIAFTVKVDSMIGVLLYKFFTDTKQNRRK